MRQNFLVVKMVKNVAIPKGTDRQLFSGNLKAGFSAPSVH